MSFKGAPALAWGGQQGRDFVGVQLEGAKKRRRGGEKVVAAPS